MDDMTDKALLHAYLMTWAERDVPWPGVKHQAKLDRLRAEVLARMGPGWRPIGEATDEVRDGRQVLVRQGDEQAVVRYMRSVEDGDGQWIIYRQLQAHNADGFAIRMPDPTHFKLLDAAPAAPRSPAEGER